jgi:2-polyprenyl-3-methyl-5-hydroxy-6-metoxy-1,4-benzoquinol methylase
MHDSDRAWNRIGATDPYFGVLTSDGSRAASQAGPARDEFFRSGTAHIDRVFGAVRALVPEFAPRRAADFGCGVGRLVMPLARKVSEVVGIDISPAMLAEARSNCEREGLTNVSFCQSPTELKGSFDFIHSFIVFQHIPVDRGLDLARILVEHLALEGVGALHFTYVEYGGPLRKLLHRLYKWVPGFYSLVSLLLGRRHPLMQMNAYSMNRVLALLQSQGCHRVAVYFSNHGGSLGALVVFQKHELLLY